MAIHLFYILRIFSLDNIKHCCFTSQIHLKKIINPLSVDYVYTEMSVDVVDLQIYFTII